MVVSVARQSRATAVRWGWNISSRKQERRCIFTRKIVPDVQDTMPSAAYRQKRGDGEARAGRQKDETMQRPRKARMGWDIMHC